MWLYTAIQARVRRARVGLTVFLNGFIEPLAIVHLFGLPFLVTSSISKRRCRLSNFKSKAAGIVLALLCGCLSTRLWRRNAGRMHAQTGESDGNAHSLLVKQLTQSPCAIPRTLHIELWDRVLPLRDLRVVASYCSKNLYRLPVVTTSPRGAN